MKRMCLPLILIATLAGWVACAGDGSSTPGAPTASPSASPTVTAVTVSGQTPSGFSVQLTATALLSDGTTRDVTTMATWSSSNESVITVSPMGLASIVGTGSADVRASYQNVVGTLAIEFGGGFAVSGRVREEAPNAPTLSAVRVEVVSGPRAGAFVMSDATGAFRISNLTGLVDLQATRPGYFPWRLGSLTVDHDLTIDVTMYASPPANAAGETATARCQDGTWTWARTLADACTANGGILYGVCPGALCAATRSIR
jgi:hypothetical protein